MLQVYSRQYNYVLLLLLLLLYDNKKPACYYCRYSRETYAINSSIVIVLTRRRKAMSKQTKV